MNSDSKQDIDEDQQNSGRIFGVLIIVLLVLYGLYVRQSEKQDAKNVKAAYFITQGQIVYYLNRRGTDASSGRTITYSYRVNTKNYSRPIDTQIIFTECEDTRSGNDIREECARKRFWVIYSKKDPSKSLINLDIDIQDQENPQFPNTLDGFY